MVTAETLDATEVFLLYAAGILLTLGVGGLVADYRFPHIKPLEHFLDSLPMMDDEGGARVSRCKFCGALIDWIWSQERGGYVKVDAEPVFVNLSDGEVTFITNEGGILQGRLAPDTGDHTGQDVAFIPHSCGGCSQYIKNKTKKQEKEARRREEAEN